MARVFGKFWISLLILIALPASAQWQWEVLDLGFDAIVTDSTRLETSLAAGQTLFQTYCVACHGVDARSAHMPGVPDLTLAQPMWGSSLVEMAYVVKYGIRSGHDKARFSQMPGYKADGTGHGYSDEVLADLTLFVQHLQGHPVDAAVIERVEDLAMYVCTECHGYDFKGQTEWYGAPGLTGDMILFGNAYEDIYRVIAEGAEGVSPAWETILSDDQIRDVVLYLDSLR